MNCRVTLAVFALPLLVAWTVLCAASQDEGIPSEYYRVVDGKVDRGTYTGWQVFRENCAGCHGVDALGTDGAPNLVERIPALSVAEFRAKVLSRYFVTVPLQDVISEGSMAARDEMAAAAAGEAEAGTHMPPWRDNPDVSEHIDQLYAYLTGRADGVIGPGVPEVIGQ